MQNEFLGYQVEKVTNPETPHVAYKLHKRTTYTLWRRPNGTMFVTNSRGNLCTLRGYSNFADDGEKGLRPICLY